MMGSVMGGVMGNEPRYPFHALDCLLVDDDPLIRLCVKTMVVAAGHQVTSAGDGAEAIDILSSHRFDVVISDIRMPKLDGWGLIEHVRRSTPDTDVILMTAYATGPDAMRAFMRGACEYLRKPLDAEELTSHLRQISERRAKRIEVATEIPIEPETDL